MRGATSGRGRLIDDAEALKIHGGGSPREAGLGGFEFQIRRFLKRILFGSPFSNFNNFNIKFRTMAYDLIFHIEQHDNTNQHMTHYAYT